MDRRFLSKKEGKKKMFLSQFKGYFSIFDIPLS